MTMERETFEDPETIRWVEDNFVPVHFDVLADEEPMSRFNSGWKPILLVRDADGNELRRSQGYLAPARFKAEMALALLKANIDRRDFQAAHALAPATPPTREQYDDMAGDEGAFLIGNPSAVAAKMLRADAVLGGLSRITFQMSTASLETEAMRRSIELLGTEVAPIIRAAKLAS